VYSSSDEFTIRPITSIEAFLQLSDVWDELISPQTPYRPFLCFDWFKTWLNHFLTADQLSILLLFRNHDIVAIAPFILRDDRFKGIKVRKLELIGNIYSPIRSLLIHDTEFYKSGNILPIILRFLAQQNTCWDIIELSPIPEESRHFGLLNDSLNQIPYKNSQFVCFTNWYLDNIDYSSSTFFSNLSKNMKRNIKRTKRNAEKAGELKFRMLSKPEEVSQNIKTYFSVYARSWKKEEEVGPHFHMDLTRLAAQKGWLRLGFVYLGDVPIVTGFALVCEDIAYFSKNAYDQAYRELGAGTIWMSEMIKYVVDVDKVHVIDFLRGDEPYKRRWLKHHRERRGFLIFNNTWKGNLLSHLDQHVIPALNRSHLFRETKSLVAKKFFRRNAP